MIVRSSQKQRGDSHLCARFYAATNCAKLSGALKAGEVSEDEVIERLSRSPQWVWVAMDPKSKLLLTIDVGERSTAMAQRVVHQVAQVLAPDCAPLFLTDGFREYMTALLTHYGHWMQPPRRQGKGPLPKPRWLPLPAAALCAGHQNGAPAAFDPRTPPRCVRDPRGRPTGLSSMRLADQYRVY